MNVEDKFQREEDLICEALVREIGRASRWSARVEAWDALLSTRREGQSLRDERTPKPSEHGECTSPNMDLPITEADNV